MKSFRKAYFLLLFIVPAAALAAKDNSEAESSNWWLWPTLASPLILALLLNRLYWWRVRSRPCPDCREKGLVIKTEVLEYETDNGTGTKRRITDCPNCGYHDEWDYGFSKVGGDD